MVSSVISGLVDKVREIIYILAYSAFTRIHPDRDPVRIRNRGKMFEAENAKTGEAIFVHDYAYAYRVQSGGFPTYADRISNKYTMEGFAEFQTGDVVVDVGALVGGFSIAAGTTAERVLAVEPDPRLQEPLRATLEQYDAVSLHQVALTDEPGDVEFILGTNPSENSIINVDTGGIEETVTVTGTTIEEFTRSAGIDTIDFLKIDAEGAEPEVIAGFGEMRPRTVAVDGSAEREGSKTVDELVDALNGLGYEVRTRNDVVFGRRKRND